MINASFLSALGLLVLLFRLKSFQKPLKAFAPVFPLPFVSIIVPCRNEESNIAGILKSLLALRYPEFEIIVVDDESTDKTNILASSFPTVRVLSAPEKPSDWVGKTWACSHGASAAKGDLLLFTDADTRHHPDSLMQSVSYLLSEKAGMISAPCYHECLNRFEKFLGLFHLLPLISTAYRDDPSEKRHFAIGQYLLFSRKSYETCGGHSEVRGSLAEDMDLAKVCLDKSQTYGVFPDSGLYSVQMYSSAGHFWNGWKRLLRIGMRRSSVGSFIEIVLVIHLFGTLTPVFPMGLAVLLIAQRSQGAFSAWGVLLAPINIALFVALSGAAAIDTLLNRKVEWHDRTYANT